MPKYTIYENEDGTFNNKRVDNKDKKHTLTEDQMAKWSLQLLQKERGKIGSRLPSIPRVQHMEENTAVIAIANHFERLEVEDPPKSTDSKELMEEASRSMTEKCKRKLEITDEENSFNSFIKENEEKLMEIMIKAYNSGKKLEVKLHDNESKPETQGLLAKYATAAGQEWCETQGFKVQTIITNIPLVIQTKGKAKAITDLRNIAVEMNPNKAPNEPTGIRSIMFELIGEIEHLDNRITKPGKNLNNNKIILKLLTEEAYEKFRANCKSLDSKMQNRTLEEHQRAIARGNHEITYTVNGSRRTKGKGKGKYTYANKSTCLYCGKAGHFIRDCLKRKNENSEPKQNWLRKAE